MFGTGRAGVFMFVVAVLVLQAGCARELPERELRAALTSLQASVEARDVSGIEATLTSDFVGQDGMDRDGAVRLARLMFLRHREIGAIVGPPRISIRDSHATAGFTVALTGGAGAMLPDAAAVHDVHTAWRTEDGQWRLISAQWAPRP